MPCDTSIRFRRQVPRPLSFTLWAAGKDQRNETATRSNRSPLQSVPLLSGYAVGGHRFRFPVDEGRREEGRRGDSVGCS